MSPRADALFALDLGAMLDGPLGSCVVFNATQVSGILNAEYREDDAGDGLTHLVHVTVLTVKDGALPDTCREGQTLTVDGRAYKVRKRGRADDMGAVEFWLAAVTS